VRARQRSLDAWRQGHTAAHGHGKYEAHVGVAVAVRSYTWLALVLRSRPPPAHPPPSPPQTRRREVGGAATRRNPTALLPRRPLSVAPHALHPGAVRVRRLPLRSEVAVWPSPVDPATRGRRAREVGGTPSCAAHMLVRGQRRSLDQRERTMPYDDDAISTSSILHLVRFSCLLWGACVCILPSLNCNVLERPKFAIISARAFRL
jgi:hypothetical protein